MTIEFEGRPPLQVLRYINPAEFNARHLESLKRLEAEAWDGTTARDWALRIHQGLTWLWEVDGTESAIVLTSSDCGPDNALFLEGLAGNGILANKRAIIEDLKVIAREYGANQISTATARDTPFSRLAQEMGFSQVSVNYSLTLEDPDDGQQEVADDDHRNEE